MSQPEVSQSMIDHIFGNGVKTSLPAENLPTGINSITLRKIKEALRTASEGLTAEELGEKWERHERLPAAMPSTLWQRKKQEPSLNTGLSAGRRENIIWRRTKYEKMYDSIDCSIDLYAGDIRQAGAAPATGRLKLSSPLSLLAAGMSQRRRSNLF